jgi:hypothetical protein
MYEEIPSYDPSDFEESDDLDQIRRRLKKLIPSEDSPLELAHLNREAARLIEDMESDSGQIALSQLYHTFEKDIKTAVEWHVNSERIGAFKLGVEHTLLDIAAL